METAKWLSQMIGQETTGFQTDSYKPGDNPSFSNNLTGRDLLTPDEIMQMPPNVQLQAALLRRPRVQGAVRPAGPVIQRMTHHDRRSRLPCPARR